MEEFELEPGESVTMSVRKHWLIIFAHLVGFALLAYLPFLFHSIIGNTAMQQPGLAVLANAFDFNNPWIRLALGTWWLFLWMAAFAEITRYCLTVWIITTTRIVDIHQHGWFNREVSSLLLVRVQDVTTTVDGFFATLFGYGELEVESAGAKDRFIMDNIAHSQTIRDLIMSEIAALHGDGQADHSGGV
jgi:uncharacterized membrane protein YdbT with pleckstrin-like domain